MLEGMTLTEEYPLPQEWRDYRLVKLTGWTLEQIDAADAVTCDWFLEFENLENDVRAKAHDKAANRTSSSTVGAM